MIKDSHKLMKKAVILCGGKGSRLKPITETIPKVMVNINGKPLLEYKLEILEKYLDEVILIVGYKKEIIINHYGNNFGKMKIIYKEQKELLGTGHAILQAKDLLDDEFLVINGDDIFKAEDIEKILKTNLGILGYKTQTPENFGVLEINQGCHLINIEEKPKKPKSNLVNIGLYALNKEIFSKKIQKSKRGEYEITDYLKHLINLNKKIKVIPTTFWIPVGTPKELEKAKNILSN